MNRHTWVLLQVLQAGVLAMAVFIDFGFDLPGQFGLSFGHFLIAVGTYGVLLLAGVFVATVSREYRKILNQLVILLTICIVGAAYHLVLGP